MNEAMVAAAMKAAQAAQGWSDKALFLFVLMLLIGVFIGAVRYLATRNEEQQKQLVELYQEANTGRIEMAKALSVTADVTCETRECLVETRRVVAECTDFLRRAKHH